MICLYRIQKKILLKSTCLTGSNTCPGPSGNGIFPVLQCGILKQVSYNLTNIGTGNGLSPVRRQAITWNNADLLSVGPLEKTNLNEINIRMLFEIIHLEMSSAK